MNKRYKFIDMNRQNEFRLYLRGEKKSYPCSLTTDSIKQVLAKITPKYESVFDCTDVEVLTDLLSRLNVNSKDEDVVAALKYGGQACRPALKYYIKFLNKEPYTVTSTRSPKPSRSARTPLKKIDGLEILVDLTRKDGGLLNHMLKYTLFFNPETVKEDMEEMKLLDRLVGKDTDDTLPVRYSSKLEYYGKDGKLIQEANKGKTSLFNNNRAIYKYCEKDHFSELQGRNCKIQIDKDGNYATKDKIKTRTGHKVSWGRDSTITYYMISHIWGETYDPFFFSSLWNLALVPTHCAPILDKDDAVSIDIKTIKDTYKAICYLLYLKDLEDDQLRELFRNKNIENPKSIDSKILESAQKYIDGKNGFELQFI